MKAGDELDAVIELDTAPREVELPEDLAEALAGNERARRFFEKLSFTHRKNGCAGSPTLRRPRHASHALRRPGRPSMVAGEHADLMSSLCTLRVSQDGGLDLTLRGNQVASRLSVGIPRSLREDMQ